MIAVCFGNRAAAAATAAGNPGPHFTSWYPAIARRCGSCGFASPICRNTLRRYARSLTGLLLLDGPDGHGNCNSE